MQSAEMAASAGSTQVGQALAAAAAAAARGDRSVQEAADLAPRPPPARSADRQIGGVSVPSGRCRPRGPELAPTPALARHRQQPRPAAQPPVPRRASRAPGSGPRLAAPHCPSRLSNATPPMSRQADRTYSVRGVRTEPAEDPEHAGYGSANRTWRCKEGKRERGGMKVQCRLRYRSGGGGAVMSRLFFFPPPC